MIQTPPGTLQGALGALQAQPSVPGKENNSMERQGCDPRGRGKNQAQNERERGEGNASRGF